MFNSALDALYACRNHWSWLYITGDYNKYLYIPSNSWYAECACCQYTLIDKKITCNKCPLNEYAWKIGCIVSDDSFYNKWTRSHSDAKRSIYAYQMVQACNRAIEDILTKG